jgi:hypothetical protein
MAVAHVPSRRPIGRSLEGLAQWAEDHQAQDDDVHARLESILSWMVRGLVAVLLTAVLGLAATLWNGAQARQTALEQAQIQEFLRAHH